MFHCDETVNYFGKSIYIQNFHRQWNSPLKALSKMAGSKALNSAAIYCLSIRPLDSEFEGAAFFVQGGDEAADLGGVQVFVLPA